MSKKLTQEEFIELAHKVHNKYTYTKTVYVQRTSKIIITCPIHGDFVQTVRDHLNGAGCAKCVKDAQRLTVQQFIERSRKVHGDKYDYSNVVYVNNQTPVEIICPTHGCFRQSPANHMNGSSCPKCQKKAKHTKESFIDEAVKVHGNKYEYNKINYVQNKSKVIITCPEHGDFIMTPNAHLSGQGCPKCGVVSAANKNRKTTEQFIKEAKLVHGDLYNYSLVEYAGKDHKVKIICPKHGIFEQSPHNHVSSKHGCPKCILKHQFDIYKKLQQIFASEVILFEVDSKTVSWLKRQRFDIYFPKYNIAIEYDGPQHFIEFKHYKKGKEGLETTQERDIRKNQICQENNCLLLRLKYDYSENDFNTLIIKIKNRIKQWDLYTEKHQQSQLIQSEVQKDLEAV